MNDLFSVFKNHIFLNLYQILRDMEHGISYTSTEVHDTLYSPMAFHPAIEDFISQIMTIFFIINGQQAKSRFSLSLPPLSATTAEKEWLKTVLMDKTCHSFFSKELRNKLEQALTDVKGLPMPAVFNSPDLLQANVEDNLRIFQEALWQQRKLELCLCGEQEAMRIEPLRLEYDTKSRHFTYLFYEKNHGFQRLAVTKVQTLHLLPERLSADMEERYQSFLSEHTASLVLQLTPKWNAVERCFLLFDDFEKEAVYNEEKNVYILIIQYYDFDEETILDDIFSLGSAVKILSPARLQERLKNRLQAACDRYR